MGIQFFDTEAEASEAAEEWRGHVPRCSTGVSRLR